VLVHPRVDVLVGVDEEQVAHVDLLVPGRRRSPPADPMTNDQSRNRQAARRSSSGDAPTAVGARSGSDDWRSGTGWAPIIAARTRVARPAHLYARSASTPAREP